MGAIKYRTSANDPWQDLTVLVGPQGPAGPSYTAGDGITIDANNEISANFPYDVIEYQANISDYTAAQLQQIYDYTHSVAGAKPCVILKDGQYYHYVSAYFGGISGNRYSKVCFVCPGLFQITLNQQKVYMKSFDMIVFVCGPNDTTFTSQNVSATLYLDPDLIYFNNTDRTLKDEIDYIKSNYQTTLTAGNGIVINNGVISVDMNYITNNS